MTISPSQFRAARALLDLSQEALATASGVSARTVFTIETGRKTIPATKAAVMAALLAGGVVFIPPGDDEGPGVRLARPEA